MIRFFAAHPTAANLLMIMFIVMGLVAIPSLQRETFPDFAPTEVQVSVVYPGASPGEVEEAVCQRIEDAIDGVEYVEEVRSRASENLAVVVAEMEDAGEITTFLNDVTAEVDAISDFPDKVEDPVIEQLGRVDQVISIAVYGDMGAGELKEYARSIKDDMKRKLDLSRDRRSRC